MSGPRRLLRWLARAVLIAAAVTVVRDRLIARNQAKYGFEPLAGSERSG